MLECGSEDMREEEGRREKRKSEERLLQNLKSAQRLNSQ